MDDDGRWRDLVREHATLDPQSPRAQAIAKVVHNHVARGDDVGAICPGEEGYVDGYVLGPGYNACGDGRSGAHWREPVGRDDPMDAMFQSFNPGSDEARRQWRRRQQAGGDGAASEATQSEVTSEGDGAEAEA